MSLPMQLLHCLASARAREQHTPQFVSGAALASRFGVTRSAVWKAIGSLRERGTEIEAITRRGYRLALPASPLTAAGIVQHLPEGVRLRLRDGQCLDETESTNTALLARGAPPSGSFDFLTAEYQHAGRGRRGRTWLAPPGGSLCMSWSWCFPGGAGQLGALSLATGVAVRRALAACGIGGIRLKWPNDLVTSTGKLGGILIEMRSEAAGPLHVVVGLGLNLTLGRAMREFIEAGGNAASDLAELLPDGLPPARELLAARLLEHNVALLADFERDGFGAVLHEYATADALRGRTIAVLGSGIDGISGIAQGVDSDGALLVSDNGQLRRIVAGEVSVRPGTAT